MKLQLGYTLDSSAIKTIAERVYKHSVVNEPGCFEMEIEGMPESVFSIEFYFYLSEVNGIDYRRYVITQCQIITGAGFISELDIEEELINYLVEIDYNENQPVFKLCV